MEQQKPPRATAPPGPTVRVVAKHHALVRLTHWANLPLLFGLLASGLSIYWAAPVFTHAARPGSPRGDWLMDAGTWIANALHDHGGAPGLWIYDHAGLGGGQLAIALRLHWALAYFFMVNGALYLLGLIAGGGWRALLPRPADGPGALAMMRYYAGVVPMALLRRPWPHPHVASKYNALQRAAYFSMPVFGTLIVASGWAMHKPSQLGWLAACFGGYDGARVLHFISMVVLGTFIVPHVVLVIADGWDTFRSMITGWSLRVKDDSHE
ncbi:MAG TPA: cytochrome b/b6 domain-containing protein [Candidatus Acidoferrales bacterium]|nr:cytochrome b/b6 domain-containing protein [Candidatus Acidoferrales bacterium]